MIFAIAAGEGKAIGLFLTLALLCFGIIHLKTIVLGLLSLGYAKTKGVLFQMPDGSFEYEYNVEGVTFRGRRLSYLITRPTLVEFLVEHYHASTKPFVDVYYDRLNPRNAVLQIGITIPSFIWILIWFCAFACTIALALDLNEISSSLHWDSGGGGL